MPAKRILIVDDEPDIRNLLKEILEDEGFRVDTAKDANQARSLFKCKRLDLILLDIWMPDIDGITLLKEWKKTPMTIPIVMISGHGTVETAVEATQLGAYDFIEKPLSLAKLLLTVKNALKDAMLQQENVKLRLSSDKSKEELPEEGSLLQKACKQIDSIANNEAPVLLVGDAGTCKQKYAYYLHKKRQTETAFVAINVASLSHDFAEMELFGTDDLPGYLDRVGKGGTLFIKDIAELDLKLQSRLQSAIESKIYSHIGSNQSIGFDARIVAATGFNLRALVESGKFRSDLFYQLNILPINIPRLNQHPEDVFGALSYYVDFFVATEQLPYRYFSSAAQNRLINYDWPGNIRELKNLVQRLLMLGKKDMIEIDELESLIGNKPISKKMHPKLNLELPLREARRQFERLYLLFQLEKAGWNITKSAKTIGVERTHLYRKLKLLGINIK